MASEGRPPGPDDDHNRITRDEFRDPKSAAVNDDASGPKPSLGSSLADANSVKKVCRKLQYTALKFGTWNVRTMNKEKLPILTREIDRVGLSITGISELRFTGKGHFTTDDGHAIYYSGDDKKRQHGVGFVVGKNTKKSVLGYNPVSERVITIRLQANPVNFTIVQVYAPTSAADEATVDEFYQQVQEVLDKIPQKDVTIVMGDLNAKVGNDVVVTSVMGRHGLGKQNEAGEKLVDFCINNNLVITNTRYSHHPRRNYTWTSPDVKTRNQID